MVEITSDFLKYYGYVWNDLENNEIVTLCKWILITPNNKNLNYCV